MSQSHVREMLKCNPVALKYLERWPGRDFPDYEAAALAELCWGELQHEAEFKEAVFRHAQSFDEAKRRCEHPLRPPELPQWLAFCRKQRAYDAAAVSGLVEYVI